ncbi:hypothetical protein [Natronobeatus ordinarius]|uniref:hypothetical protein n=1 Tax=Natronobeatus ordinarius TaxID=2963433 RepID=UPI0020CBF938|nr:hypothetical protein [Natronobeatus ordinarius]
MDERRLLGLLGTLVIAATAVVGLVAFVTNYGLDPADPALLVPTVATLAVAAGFVLVLSGLGSNASGGVRSSYW